MTCRACGATIAERAIVCYKCGTATMDGPAVPRTPVAGSRGRVFLVMLAFVAAVAALGVWLIPQTAEGHWTRWAAWAAVPIIVYAGARLIRGPRSSRLRRR